MGNIIITNKCNLKCSYCFANEITNKKIEIFTVENFIKAVNFIKTSPKERLGIAGGEPTIHPNFSDFIKIINNDTEIKNCIIYTNGIELEKYINLITNKFSLLINCNSPENIGSLYNKLENSLKKLSKENKNNYEIGINIYSPNMDYSYIFDLAKLGRKNFIRFSISISNQMKKQKCDVLECYGQFYQILINFYNECIKREIIPIFDCNEFPLCLFDKEMKKVMLKIFQLQKESKIFCSSRQCMPTVDILPDLSAIRSICYPYYKKVYIANFKSIDMLRIYFYNEIDSLFSKIYISEKCKNCKYKVNKICGICPTFFLDKYLESIKK